MYSGGEVGVGHRRRRGSSRGARQAALVRVHAHAAARVGAGTVWVRCSLDVHRRNVLHGYYGALHK